jgi:hypothetical protein
MPQPVATDLSRGQLLLSFYDKRPKRTLGFTVGEEKVYWEQWLFPMLINKRPRISGARGSPEGKIEIYTNYTSSTCSIYANTLMVTLIYSD